MSARRLAQYRRFVDAFHRAAERRTSVTEYFSQWLECTWAFMNACVDRPTFHATLDRYTAAEGAEVARIFFEHYVPLAEDADWEDVLGPVWMDLSEGRQGFGQYFTPWELLMLMARIGIHDALPEIRARRAAGERFTVHDPCCGSGGGFLAFAVALREAVGSTELHDTIDYSGQDIDQRCVWMTKIQLRINGLDILGRSLRLAAGVARTRVDDTAPRLFAPDYTVAREAD